MKKHLITSKSKFSSAFSLVELLVVIAVIAIIAAIAIRNIQGVREGAKDSKLASDTAAVERRLGEAKALGYTNLTIADILAGTNLTDPDTGMTIFLQVESDFTAAELAGTSTNTNTP